jgi:hypothetical protein
MFVMEKIEKRKSTTQKRGEGGGVGMDLHKCKFSLKVCNH